MSKEAILRVMAAEDEAKRIILDAEARAALMIKEARENAEKDYSDHTRSLDAEYRRRFELVSADAEILIRERRNDAERDAKLMCQEAVANVPPAVREVVRRIINECQ